jgi:glyoxylase-like metal-dependent hydrolase (beta-lactamase superfamily II)
MHRTLFLILSACSLPYVAPHPFTQPAAVATPIEVCWLETGGVEASGGFGAAGRVHADTWHATTSVLLVRHPKGDVIIDTGLSPTPQDDAKELSGWRRFVFSQTAARNEPRGSLPKLLKAAGAGPLAGIVLSHAHADHAGGLSLVPGAPVWVPKEEIEFAHRGDGAVLPPHARAIGERAVPIPFAAQGYAGYAQSWDVFGDGTLVVVPTFGHTPGSVATFVNLGPRRLVHVGDLINLQESVEREAPKSWLMSTLTDEDRGATEREVARLVRLQRQDPALWILPAHDRAAYEAFFGELPVDTHEPRCVTR